GKICGFTPSSSAAGAPSPTGISASRRTPAGASARLGSTMVTSAGSSPASSQRDSMAPAMLPQPISQSGPGKASPPPIGSGLALGLDQRGGNRLLRRLVGPQDELEDRIEALALLDRGLDQGLGLLQAH